MLPKISPSLRQPKKLLACAVDAGYNEPTRAMAVKARRPAATGGKVATGWTSNVSSFTPTNILVILVRPRNGLMVSSTSPSLLSLSWRRHSVMVLLSQR
mgnify:CR=1 FL=1